MAELPPKSHKNLQAARERLILALDYPSAQQSFEFLRVLRERSSYPPLWVKVGLELFLAEGPLLVRALREEGYSVFLDLKLHDIPNTVAAAVRALRRLDVQLLTVHAAGGPAMLAAAAGAMEGEDGPKLLAVTVLTSMDTGQLGATGVEVSTQKQVLRLARMAKEAGIAGLVSSPIEASMLRAALGGGVWLVTPGIRPDGLGSNDDQQRVATPVAALAAGANQLVVGRPITRANDPASAYGLILEEIATAMVEGSADKERKGSPI